MSLGDRYTDPELTPEQLHKLGLAIGVATSAVEQGRSDLHKIARQENLTHAHVIGEIAVIALAKHGFVVEHDPDRAAAIMAEAERLAPKLS